MALALGARDRRFESCHPDKVSKLEDALAQITEEHAIAVFAASYGKCDAIKRFNLPMNGTGCRIVDALISRFAIDVSHFDPSKQNRRYERVIRQCPTCSKPFVTSVGSSSEKITCSRACSNTYFRSGANNPNFKPDADSKHNVVCWRYHKRCCVICGESNIVEAHHHNGDHSDNRPENFVPLCPTHHQYWHSRYKHLIQTQVNEYVEQFQQRRVAQPGQRTCLGSRGS